MTINVIDESETLLAGWWTRKGERYISGWLTIYDQEKRWFEQQMINRFGKKWDDDED